MNKNQTYVIRIIGSNKPTNWYAGRIGQEYRACLKEIKDHQETGIMLIPQLRCWVFPGDYEIIE